ncbi:MAG TPA: hypothetical protein VHX20_02090, partial [Terracidiphilus sp.]|nr:hypothetical protein [Terracidiphilus sp.]
MHPPGAFPQRRIGLGVFKREHFVVAWYVIKFASPTLVKHDPPVTDLFAPACFCARRVALFWTDPRVSSGA